MNKKTGYKREKEWTVDTLNSLNLKHLETGTKVQGHSHKNLTADLGRHMGEPGMGRGSRCYGANVNPTKIRTVRKDIGRNWECSVS